MDALTLSDRPGDGVASSDPDFLLGSHIGLTLLLYRDEC